MSDPATLGRYQVRRRLGSGAFATVWICHDESLDSPVAVKLLADNWADDLWVRRRFVEEGRLLRRVSSPYVVAALDAGEAEDGRPYLVMAYADGGTLKELVAGRPLEPARAVRVAREVAEGLSALHRRGIIHRDLTPGNVLLTTVEDQPGEVRALVGDLGLGKHTDASAQLTRLGGTPAFVSPEQARGEELDARSDQYALAALTHYLLTGRAPFTHGSFQSAAQPGEPPALPEAVAAAAPVVRRGLAADREHRFVSVTAYAEALERALADEPITILEDLDARADLPEAERGHPLLRWLAWTLAAVMAVVLGALAGVWLQQQLDGDASAPPIGPSVIGSVSRSA